MFHHCRNSHIKQDIMYFLESHIDGFEGYGVTVRRNGEIQTASIKINTNDTAISKLDIAGYPQEEDEDSALAATDKQALSRNKVM